MRRALRLSPSRISGLNGILLRQERTSAPRVLERQGQQTDFTMSEVQLFSEVAERRRANLQLTLPKLCFQSLMTPGGNCRLPTPVRRQASGHISSKERSSRNSSVWETWCASERGDRSAAIFKSSMSGAISCLSVFMAPPFSVAGALHITKHIAVSGITKMSFRRLVIEYFNAIPNLSYKRYRAGDSGGLMKSTVVKRSIVVEGHKTSVSLEDAFWTDLKKIAHNQQVTLCELIAKIDDMRGHSNLSSAIRVFVLHHFLSGDKPKPERSAVDDERQAHS